MNPPKWTDVYPHGTQKGDEELKFFIALTRNQKYQWRSTSALAKESGLSKQRIEEIIQKYYKKGMVFLNPKNVDQWGYWERVPEMLPEVRKSIAARDQGGRIDRVVHKDCSDLCFPADNAAPDCSDVTAVQKGSYCTDTDFWLPLVISTESQVENHCRLHSAYSHTFFMNDSPATTYASEVVTQGSVKCHDEQVNRSRETV